MVTAFIPRRRALVLLSLALAAAAWCAVASGQDGSSAQQQAGAAGTAPIPSNALASESHRFDSARRSAEMLCSWVRHHHATVGLSVVEVATGRRVAACNAAEPLNPASNSKLLTAAVVLERLGPEHRFTTSLHGRLRRGSVDGLVLRGDGDPSITAETIAEMARDLVLRGLRRVDGAIAVDQSRFDDHFAPPAFDQQPNEWASFRAPVSAVAVDRNVLTLYVSPSDSGKPAVVRLEPEGVAQISGVVKTEPAGSKAQVRWDPELSEGQLRAKLSGGLAEDSTWVIARRRLDDPRLAPGLVLAHALKRLGVEIEGKVVAWVGGGLSPPLVIHRSPELGTLVQALGKESDNFTAEMLLKALGSLEADGKPASSEDGARVVLDWIRQLGPLEQDTRFINGSGLFDANRLSADLIVRVLVRARQDPRIFPEYLAQLAVGGVDGTLRERFGKHRKDRAVRAKTGTLRDVVSLSGYVELTDRSPLAFCILVNGMTDHGPVRSRIDAFVESLIHPS